MFKFVAPSPVSSSPHTTWMEPAPEQREVEGRGGAFWYDVRGAPLASYGLVAHFPSCSPVVVVVVVVRTFTGAKTKLSHQQNYFTTEPAGPLSPMSVVMNASK